MDNIATEAAEIVNMYGMTDIFMDSIPTILTGIIILLVITAILLWGYRKITSFTTI